IPAYGLDKCRRFVSEYGNGSSDVQLQSSLPLVGTAPSGNPSITQATSVPKAVPPGVKILTSDLGTGVLPKTGGPFWVNTTWINGVSVGMSMKTVIFGCTTWLPCPGLLE